MHALDPPRRGNSRATEKRFSVGVRTVCGIQLSRHPRHPTATLRGAFWPVYTGDPPVQGASEA
eukprot:CAMPEP_0184723202 /NCGR_PEP_ID=MMETSP0314-20130426/24475_1 /TAXON_ID=38298 /ORGANISM="Rhodella maculata, Strain CCMP 736" /LENGTH=62 /DNA_ID=CAMNT_0027187959 /DNA_START=221 /DNA_END=406 /DNA_ORIENTATION=-